MFAAFRAFTERGAPAHRFTFLSANLLFACFDASARAEMRHVSPSGSDKTGTGSVSKPWATAQHAVDNSGAGDTVLLAAGIYKTALAVGESGSKEDGFLTIMGEDGAVISGAALDDTPSVLIENQSYIRLANLTFTGNTSKNESYAVLIQGRGARLEVINCRFSDLKGKNAVAIAVHGTSAKQPLEKVKIDGCVVEKCQPAPSEAIVINGNVDGWEVTNNQVRDVNNIALDFIGGERDTLKDKTKVARNGLVSGNRVERARSSYGEGYAAGIYVDGGKDIVIERNIVTECDLGIELGAENKGAVTTSITVRDNHIFLNDKAGIAIGGYESSVGRVNDCIITGNTFYQNTMAKDHQAELWLQHGSGNQILRNSFWTKTGTPFVAADNGGLKNILNDNTWWCDSGPEKTRWQWGDDPSQGWKAYLEASGQDTRSVFEKPTHPNPDKGEFQQASAR